MLHKLTLYTSPRVLGNSAPARMTECHSNTVLFDVTVNIAVVLLLMMPLYLMSVCHSVAMNMFLVAIHLPSSVVLAIWNFVGRKFCHCSVGLYARMAAQHCPQTAFSVVFSVPRSVSPTENSMLSLNFIIQWKTY